MRRGFSLVELMVVLAIVVIGSGMALFGISRNQENDDLDAFAKKVRAAISTARWRAIATGNDYLVDIRYNSVSWCRINTNLNNPTRFNPQLGTVCPGSPDWEMNRPQPTGARVTAIYWAQAVDDTSNQSVTRLNLCDSCPTAPLYLFGSGSYAGSADSNLTNASNVPDGLTLYLQGKNSDKKRKILVYPYGARAVITENW